MIHHLISSLSLHDSRYIVISLKRHIIISMIKQQHLNNSHMNNNYVSNNSPLNNSHINNSSHMNNNPENTRPCHPHSDGTPRNNSGESADILCTNVFRQYYNTVSVAARTDNFKIASIVREMPRALQQDYSELKLLDFVQRWPYLTLVGNIVKIEDAPIRNKQGDSCQETQKSSESSENSLYNFHEQECLKIKLKPTLLCVGKESEFVYILLRKQVYKEHFVKYFNRMIKNKSEKCLFTHLKAAIYLHPTQPAFYFILQPNTYLLQITEPFYINKLKPFQFISQFPYSNISLTQIYTINELESSCCDGFMLANVRQRFEHKERGSDISIHGLVQLIDENFERKSRKTKQLMMWVYKVCYTKQIKEIERCKLIVRYQPNEQNYITNLIMSDHVYLFIGPEKVITETGNILYILNNPKNNQSILRLSEEPSYINWDSLYRLTNNGSQGGLTNKCQSSVELDHWQIEYFQVVPVSYLLSKSINRNVIKLQINLNQVELIYGTIKCRTCNSEIRGNHCVKCQEQRQSQMLQEGLNPPSQGILQLWGSIRGIDSTGSCMVSLEHQQLVQFLQISMFLERIEQVVRKHVQENRTGMAIMNSNKERRKFQGDELLAIKGHIKHNFIEKIVIGYAQTNIDKTFREGLSEDEQITFHNSFQNTKKFFQQKKIFPNGLIEKKHEELYMIPYVKALKVLPVALFD